MSFVSINESMEEFYKFSVISTVLGSLFLLSLVRFERWKEERTSVRISSRGTRRETYFIAKLITKSGKTPFALLKYQQTNQPTKPNKHPINKTNKQKQKNSPISLIRNTKFGELKIINYINTIKIELVLAY